MTSSYEFSENPRQYAELVLAHSERALQAAVLAVSPETPGAHALEIFPAATEVRADAADIHESFSLSEAQERDLRAAAAELGFERSTDVNASALGLRGAHVIIEGGQPHKMVAEARMIADDKDASPTTLIFSGTPYRAITSDAEKASARKQFGYVPANEYEVARKVAEAMPGFMSLVQDEVLEVGYDINNGFMLNSETTGQFVRIGSVHEAPVIMMRIDREPYIDDEGKSVYRNQPGTNDVIKIIDTASLLQGDRILPIAFVTSATYQASRAVSAATVALETGRIIGVPTYGTARLAEVNRPKTANDKPKIPEPKRLNQLPGELHKLAKEVLKLRDVLARTELE